MANDSPSCRKIKDEENNISQKNLLNGKGSSTLGSTTTDNLGLRRSTRESSLRKQTSTSSPSNMRKSERLEKRISTSPPVKKKSERVENQVSATPLRRSDRGKKHTSSNSSGSKKSEKGSGTPDTMTKKGYINKIVKRLTLKSTEIKKSERLDSKPVVARKRKRMDGRSYKALFKAQRRRNSAADDDDDDVEQSIKMSRVDSSSSGTSGAEEVGDNECSERIGEELREERVEKASEGALRKSDSGLRNSVHVDLELSFSSWKHNEPSDGDGVKTSKSGIVKNNLDAAKRVPVDCSKEDKLRAVELVGFALVGKSLEGDINLGSGYRAIPSATVVRKEVAETCNACFKRRRVELDSENEDLCSCNRTLNKGLCDTSISEDRGELDAAAAAATGLYEKFDSVMQGNKTPLDFRTDVNETLCVICKLGGELMSCTGKGCNRSYHPSCLDPPLNDAPPGIWHCNRCVKKKIEKGVHSVSKGVESIWDLRQVEVSDAEGFQRQNKYFVKYEGLSHIHNKWVPETQLLLEAPLLVTTYLKDQAVKWNADWTVPHRLLKKRLLMPLKQRIEYLNEHGGESLSCHYEWLVKWSCLDYEHATWELENSSFLMSTQGQKLVKEYENRLQRALQAANSVDKRKKESLVKLSKLPDGSQPGIDNNHLNCVNKLRENWHKGQSSVVFDERERAMKVILYILSFSNVSQPFLIITTSNSLSHWEAEFSRLAPSIDVVVYSGNKDNRKSIRTLEFYEEGYRSMFQVLLSSMEAVVEDLQMLPSLRWESIIVDECQCPRISPHFEQIKNLATDAKVLIFSGAIKESIAEYQNLLSFLDCHGDLADNDVLKTELNDNLGKLKERFSEYIAYDCKSSRFVEFWVPVQISNVQLEQYCATLLSNSIALCSCSKHDPVGALRDTLISSRKCCDHPYLVDPSIQGSITKDLPLVEYLDVGIKASGKLQLLDVILSELKNRQLRVLILFQCIGGSGRNSIGDILDDFLRQRFGPDSYERVDAGLVMSKKQAAMNKFNSKESSRFVFLLENRACLPSIKLCSVDTVVIFDSDFNPSNDLRALHKISIDSQFEQIKIFRLYSSCTVEEKVLINAKNNVALDSNIQTQSRITTDTHTLLMWGASYLFTTLDDFYSATVADISSEPSVLNNVVKEFLDLLSKNDEIDEPSNPMIVNVQHRGGRYDTSLPLLGEIKIQLSDFHQPHVFWTKLLEGRNPQWKFLSAQTPRQRKRVQHFSDIPEKRGAEIEEVGKKRKMKVVSHIKPVEGTSGVQADNGSHSFPKSVASFTDTLDVGPGVTSKPLFSDFRTRSDSQKIRHLLLKPDISRLCEILKLSEDVKVMAERFLEYVVENHHVSKEPESIYQAFQISMCWIAASLLKSKIDRKESLSLAKEHLQFICKEEEAESIYSKLRLLKKDFLSCNENIRGTDFPKDPKLTTEDISKQASVAQVSQSLPFIPKNVKVEIVERSQIEEFSDDQVCFEMGSEEISDLIKPIQRKCEKRMAKLLQKQKEEIQEFHKRWEDKRLDLENKHKLEVAVVRTIHRNISGRLGKLRVLDEELEKKMEEHKRQKDISLRDLEEKQLRARNDEREKAVHWLAKAKSSASDDDRRHNGPKNVDPTPTACGSVPPGTTEDFLDGPDVGTQNALMNQIPENNDVETMEREKGTDNALGNLGSGKTVSTSPTCLEKQIPDGNISSVRGEEISSELPETVLCELGNFDPVETGAPAVESDQENARTDAVSSDTPNVGGNPSNEANNSSYNGELLSLVNVPSDQPAISPTSKRPSPLNLERQNECPQSLESTEMRDECAPAHPNQLSVQQVEIPPLGNVDHNHPDVLHGSTLELQGPTPSQNVADLPPASQPTPSQNVAELPTESGPTTELQGGTVSKNVADLRPASGPIASQNVADLPPASGPTASQNIAELPTTSGPTPELHGPTISQNVADLPLASGPAAELQGPTTSQNVANLPPATGSTHFRNDVASHQSADEPRNEAIIQGTNHPPPLQSEHQAAPRVATPPSYVDPLQNELNRIDRDREQTIKAHEDMKLKLKYECDKEMEEMIAQIRRKYEVKLQDAEVAFLVKKNELDTNHSKVSMNQILAEAFRCKCLDLTPSGPSNTQQAVTSGFMQQLRQCFDGPRASSVGTAAATQLFGSAPRVLGVTSSPAGPPLATPQVTVPPLQIVNQSAALFSSVPTRPLTINPITPSAGNHRAGGGEIRAPAPHLRPPPISVPSVTAPLRAIPSPSPPPAAPPPPPQLPPLATNRSDLASRPPQSEGTRGLQTPPSQPSPPPSMMAPPAPLAAPQVSPLSTNSSNLASRPPQHEGTRGLQNPHNTSLSALELLMDMDRRPNANTQHPNYLAPLPDFDSNFAPLDLADFGPLVFTSQVNLIPPTVATDLVCLSDDDE